MSRRKLSDEDRALWGKVAASVKPLAPVKRDLRADFAALLDPPRPTAKRPQVVKRAAEAAPANPVSHVPKPANTAQHPIDPPVLKKLAKGRQQIDARIDLHGMTAERARHALVDFLELSRAAGHRIVLVITGKGIGGSGVLRQSLPHWLELPPCTNLVNGYRVAHPSHGGDGAFYVRLRRPRNAGGRGLR